MNSLIRKYVIRLTNIIALLVLFMNIHAQCEQGVFEEKEGYVIIEMESADNLPANWSLHSGGESVGAGYIQFDGKNSLGSPAPNSEISYKIKINNPGTYQFKLRHNNGWEAEKFDQQNDCFVKVKANKWYSEVNDFTGKFVKVFVNWGWKYEGKIEYGGSHEQFGKADFDTAGIYEILVAGRSNGYIVDRMVFHKIEKIDTATNNLTPESDQQCEGIQDIPATGVRVVNCQTSRLDVGTPIDVNPILTPAYATNQMTIWSSSDTNIATIDSSGKIIPKITGNVIITLTSDDGGYTDECQYTVDEFLESIELVTNDLEMKVGEQYQLVIEYFPDTSTNKNVTWKVSNTSVATINSNGLLEAISPGTTPFVATAADGGHIANGFVTVTATPNSANNEYKNLDIVVSPNPCKNYFTVLSPLVNKIVISDISGKIQFEQYVDNDNTINVTGLNPETYIIHLLDNKNKVIGSKKIIKY